MTQTDFKTKYADNISKGDVCEHLVRQILGNHNTRIYMCADDGSHPVDFICLEQGRIKCVVDAKRKKQRRGYPDTGIDVRHNNTYMDFWHNNNIAPYIICMDDSTHEIYGQNLCVLNAPTRIPIPGRCGTYPFTDKPNSNKDRIRYFHLYQFRLIARFDNDMNIQYLTRDEREKHRPTIIVGTYNSAEQLSIPL